MTTRRAGVWVFSLFFISFINCKKEKSAMLNDPEESIRQVIELAYIKGIHAAQDKDLALKGFHRDFAMLVLKDNAIDKVDVDEWLTRIAKMKSENPDLWNSETTYKIVLVDATGNSAVAKLNVFKGRIHFSTDYMLLYKFDEGWKIVSKIFNVPQE